jgi:hypothetical protein
MLDEIRKAMKLRGLSLSDDRLRIIAPFLILTMETLRPLTKAHLPKELEPTTFLAKLRDWEENAV